MHLQSRSWYIETFWWFSNFSCHSKWKEALSLIINWYIRVASRVALQEDLRSYKIRKYKKNLKTSYNCSQLFSVILSAQLSSRHQDFVITSKNLLKNRNWTFPVASYFTSKLEVVCLKYFVNGWLFRMCKIRWWCSFFKKNPFGILMLPD